MIGSAWLPVVPLVENPSPRSMRQLHGASFAPGSLNVARTVKDPGSPPWSGPAFTVGAMFSIVALVCAAALLRPCASVTTSVTV